MILIVRHKAEIGLGHLTPVLDALGLVYQYTDPYASDAANWSDRIDWDAIHGLVILGGPQNVDETEAHHYLVQERDMIRRWVLADKPAFGICLGSQLIARSLEAPVYQKLYPEIGWTPIFLTEAGKADPVMSVLGDGTAQIQYHNDSFDLPYGAVLLAYSMSCPHQAYRIGQRVYGVQFHPEADLETIDDWFGSGLKASASIESEQAFLIMAETRAIYETRKRQSLAMFRAFCQRHFCCL